MDHVPGLCSAGISAGNAASVKELDSGRRSWSRPGREQNVGRGVIGGPAGDLCDFAPGADLLRIVAARVTEPEHSRSTFR
jgi:hypothetical protein